MEERHLAKHIVTSQLKCGPQPTNGVHRWVTRQVKNKGMDRAEREVERVLDLRESADYEDSPLENPKTTCETAIMQAENAIKTLGPIR